MSIPFHNTGYGRRFFDQQLPDLIKAIHRMAKAQEENNELMREYIELSKKNIDIQLESFQLQKDHVQQHQEMLNIEKTIYHSMEKLLQYQQMEMMKHVEKRIGESLAAVKETFLSQSEKDMER